MEVVLGKTSGFCNGVRNVVNKTEEYIEKSRNERIYCLGELIHNKDVLKKLEKKGLLFIDDLNEIENKNYPRNTVIIRAHGEPEIIYDTLNKKGINILDFTCPNVTAIHNIVKKYTREDFYVFLIGQKTHPEVIGTCGFCKKCSVIEKKDDIDTAIKELLDSEMKKILVVAQTTFSLEKFNEYVELIKDKVLELGEIRIEIKNTICNATRLRQEETEKISKDVDYMIIIGGKNSSNTKKLYEISKKNCKNVIFIENYKELENKLDEIKEYQKIGIMAGASTPEESIKQVVNLL